MNLYLGINKAVTHNPIPKFFGISPLIVLSGSMEPALYPGDVIVIHEKAADQYQIGDIVTYLKGTTAFTHRIISQENGVFTLKGDNNNVADEFLAAEKFEGKMVFRIPQMGYLMVFVKKPLGMAMLCLLLFLVVYGGDLYQKARSVMQRK